MIKYRHRQQIPLTLLIDVYMHFYMWKYVDMSVLPLYNNFFTWIN